ncbi:MAG: class I SAM-dependent methyltransferase [Chloroflexota bacterium]
MTENTFSPRYLAAKTSIDDRALNHHVWQTLAQNLPGASPQNPLRVLEMGAGIGTMVERLVTRGLLSHAVYTAVDNLAESIATAEERLASIPPTIHLELVTADIYDFIAEANGRKWDVLIAHAVLDMLDVERALPQLFSLLEPGGLFFFSINFDGATILQPTIDAELDVQIERLYHQTMDERVINGRLSGDSQTGRHLFSHLRNTGADILAAGSSDWVIFSQPNGTYPADEAYFLRIILSMMHTTLSQRPELDQAAFNDWIVQRQAQIESGELVYIAHQLDFVGTVK